MGTEAGGRLAVVSTTPREVPEPPHSDAVMPVTVGTAAWAVAFVVLLVLRDRLETADATWWIWVALVGFVLGLLGCWLVRRRRDAYRRAAGAAPEAGPA